MTTAKELLKTLDIDPDTLLYCEVGSKGNAFISFYESVNGYSRENLVFYFESSYLMEKEKSAWRQIKYFKDIDFSGDLATNSLGFIKKISLPIKNNEDVSYHFCRTYLSRKEVLATVKTGYRFSCTAGPAVVDYDPNGNIVKEVYYFEGANLTQTQNITTTEQLQNYLILK